MTPRWVFLVGLLVAACGVPTEPTVAELEAQARQGQQTAVDALLQRTGSRSPQTVRSEAYLALLRVGPGAGPAIREACRDPDPVRREHALALAANLKVDGAFAEAARALADNGFPRRYVAAWALGELANPAAVEPLLSALQDGDQLTAREAARSLVKLGKAATPALVDALPRLRGERLGYAVRVAGELHDPRLAQALLGALAVQESRADAAWALGKLGAPGTAAALLAHASDPAWRVRMEVARALGSLQATEADAVLDGLRASDPVLAVREWAARSLSVLRGRPEKFPNDRGEWVEPESYYK